MEKLMKPIVIGDYFDGGEMGWAWYHPDHCRLAIVGDNQLSPKREMLQEFANQFQSRDEKVVYWITGEESPKINEAYGVDAISWVENLPDPPEDYVDRNAFINNRLFFSTSYLELLSKIKGVNRKSIMPNTSYRSFVEGPLNGHLRAIEDIQEEELKEWFTQHMANLHTITWYQSKADGRKYYVDRRGTIYETALSFLRGIWSFWSEVYKMDVPQQLVLIVEPPKELLLPNVDPFVRDITERALAIMKLLTEQVTLAIILASETMYPVFEHNYRFRTIFQTKDSDFDIWSKEQQQILKYPPIYDAWKNGEKEAGLFDDELAGTRYALHFRNTNMRFMDEFDGDEDL